MKTLARRKIYHVYKHRETGNMLNLVCLKDGMHFMSSDGVLVRKIDLIFHYDFLYKKKIKRDEPPVLVSTLGGREEERVTKSGFKYRVFIKE